MTSRCVLHQIGSSTGWFPMVHAGPGRWFLLVDMLLLVAFITLGNSRFLLVHRRPWVLNNEDVYGSFWRILTIWESATLGWRRNDRGGGNQVRGRVYNASMNAAEAAKDSVRIMKKTRSPRVLSSIV
ncbi:hypothetical protein Tco_1317244 [Tanacetum coccineum]